MISLVTLFLCGTRIKELPLSIKDMICLKILVLDRTPIKTLPELPPSLMHLRAPDCESLETIMILSNTIGSVWEYFNFKNCFKLDQKPLIAAMHLKIQSGETIKHHSIKMVLPGSEIPEWFGDKGIGSSLTIQLPSNCHQLKGIAFCLIFLLSLPCHKFQSYTIYLECHVESKNGDGVGDDDEVFFSKGTYTPYKFLKTCDSDHMFLQYNLSNTFILPSFHSDHMFLYYELTFVDALRKYSGKEVTFKFYNRTSHGESHVIQKPCALKSCGVYLHFDENIRADDTLFVKNNKQKLERKLRER
ncbi:disease resistance protein [Salix suchowensis]|nr:disease resistance protein [Salix suchowensis]